MNRQFVGILIRRERLGKSWSQEGLCKGICAVSYLSKIEQGKVEANRDVIHLLLERLGAKWYDGDVFLRQADVLAERLYDAFFSLDRAALVAARQEMDANWEVLSHGPRVLDFWLLRASLTHAVPPTLVEFAADFDERQQTLWLLLQKKFAEALRLHPVAYTYLAAGMAAYQAGNYPMALERLQRGYDLAAECGYAYIMLQSRVLMGNCYSDTMDLERMQAHFRGAQRLADALGDRETLHTIRYNIESTNLEFGMVRESYPYFAALEHPNAMELHKLAVCCEKLGKPDEALAAVERAEQQEDDDFLTRDLVAAMCELIRYRLLHPDFLKEAAYGEMLLRCFSAIRERLPCGYANFHLPWALEWYTSSRQYKQAYELLLDFPYYRTSIRI